MSKQEIINAMLMEENGSVTWTSICEYYAIPEEVLSELAELGLFKNHTSLHTVSKEAVHLKRIRSASHLLRDLQINSAGVVLALELMDEIEALKQELAILNRLNLL